MNLMTLMAKHAIETDNEDKGGVILSTPSKSRAGSLIRYV